MCFWCGKNMRPALSLHRVDAMEAKEGSAGGRSMGERGRIGVSDGAPEVLY